VPVVEVSECRQPPVHASDEAADAPTLGDTRDDVEEARTVRDELQGHDGAVEAAEAHFEGDVLVTLVLEDAVVDGSQHTLEEVGREQLRKPHVVALGELRVKSVQFGVVRVHDSLARSELNDRLGCNPHWSHDISHPALRPCDVGARGISFGDARECAHHHGEVERSLTAVPSEGRLESCRAACRGRNHAIRER
jgi:hypothetical protein